MNSFIDIYQYHIAWTVYLAAGVAFCVCFWKLTGHIRHPGWRDLTRGFTLVVIGTPWFVSDAELHLAPATVVVLMDLLIGSTDNGLRATLVLLVALAVMLGILIVRQIQRSRASS